MLLDTKEFKEATNTVETGVERMLIKNLNDRAIPEIKEIILDNYSDLASYSMHRNSKLSLSDFYSDLEDMLTEHVYIEMEGGTLSFVVPDVETLEGASETLKVIQVVAEGLAGRYVELSDRERDELGLSSSNSIGFVINNKNVYLYVRTDTLTAAMRQAGIPIRRWPFSEPQNIFEEAETFVDNNLSGWITNAIERTANKANMGV